MTEFIQGFETIGGKPGRNDNETLGALEREAFHFRRRIGLQPCARTEARLKAHRTAVFAKPDLFTQEPPCLKTLIVIGVALGDFRLRQAMKGNQDRIWNETETRYSGTKGGRQNVDIGRVIVIGR